MTLPDMYEHAAGLAWRRAKGDVMTAVRYFSEYITTADFKLPSNPTSFVKKWGPALGDDGII